MELTSQPVTYFGGSLDVAVAKARSRETYRGVVVPMVTPITPGGDLDEPAVARIIDYLIKGGVHGIFVLGTTGEAALVPRPMRTRLVTIAVERAAGRVTTYAGICDNCLVHSIEAAEEYARLGIDALVAHLPSYYSLSPAEQEEYYITLASRIPRPLLVYNIPGTTHMSIPVDVVKRLSHHPNIVGLKDSERDAARLRAVLQSLGGRDDFAVLVGAAPLTVMGLAHGAVGTVPSGGNLVAGVWRALFDCAIRGDLDKAEEYQRQADAVAAMYQRAGSLGRQLSALKAAMGALSLCGPNVLPPLQPISPAEQEEVRQSFLALRGAATGVES